jgi:hypothetical protein
MKSVSRVLAIVLCIEVMFAQINATQAAPQGRGGGRKSSGLVGEGAGKQVTEKSFPKRPYSPYADRNFPMQVLWGDTHLHTSYSMDAGLFGARLGPADAYRFAKGRQVMTSTGQQAKLIRPLDFLVVADHSDGLGFFPRLLAGDPKMLADEVGRRWYGWIQEGGQQAVKAAAELIDMYSKGTLPDALLPEPGDTSFRNAWDEIIEAAEAANEPGRFTAFIGYEWTSQIAPGDNLHRVVVYRDGAAKASMMEPYTTEAPGSPNPRDLWKWMHAYEEKTGGQVLAIPHNGNLSNGIMFPLAESYDGKKVDRRYARNRIRWEPVYEVTQIKGDGEAHPFLSPNDEFADYETWDKGNLNLSVPKKKEMLQYEYARTALQTGLQIEKRVGVNPYKFGMIGSTDSHTALATADEDNFFGKHSGTEPAPGRMDHPMAKIGDLEYEGWSMVSSGYAAVWATDRRLGVRRLVYGFFGLCRGLGHGKYPQGHLRRPDAKRGLRHDRPAYDRAFFRRLGLHAQRRRITQPGGDRLPQGSLHGRRSAQGPEGKVTQLPGGRSQGPAQRQPRPHPDRQGLGRFQRSPA